LVSVPLQLKCSQEEGAQLKTSSKKKSNPIKINGLKNQDISRLADLIKIYAPYDGSFETKIPGVHAIRRSKINENPLHAIAQSGFCIVAQGAKITMLGQEVFEYDVSKMIVFSVDLPVAYQVIRASHLEPFLGLQMDLNPKKIAELALKVYPNGLPPVRVNRAIYVGQFNPEIVNASIRLLDLISKPEDAGLLGPLVVDEILIRLLRSPLGPRVAQIGLKDSGLNGVSKTVTWLRDHFSQPIKLENLAKLANMSTSTFHAHFKSVTSMSPLQYQKVLRLQEARRLMLSGMMDAGISSRQVGYISASQFSREYGRFFGAAPTQDIAKLREQMVGVSEN
jgi:AraC-like DNA-binding protein